MKKILVLTDRLPYPAISGTKNLLYNYLKILHEKLGYEVVNVSFLENDDDVNIAPAFIARTYVMRNSSFGGKIFSVVKNTLIYKNYPIQVSLYWDRRNKNFIQKIIEDEKPDVVMADLVRTAEYLKDFDGSKIIDLQDLISLRYKRQLKISATESNPYGAYIYQLPNFARKILMTNIIKQSVLKREIDLLEMYEKKIGLQYDKVMFVAKKEAEIYNKMLNEKKSVAVPLGVDIEYYSQAYTLEKDTNSIAFMGMLNVSHNESGIIHFIEDIFPLILKRRPNTQLYIIGGGLTENLKKYKTDNIVFTGRVKDIRTEVGSCKVFVCPLLFGSGIKTKNLEAMAMGIPIVTTSIGAENISASSGREWLIADDNKEFANGVIRLMEDKILWSDMRKRAFDFVESNFNWTVTENELKKIL